MHKASDLPAPAAPANPLTTNPLAGGGPPQQPRTTPPAAPNLAPIPQPPAPSPGAGPDFSSMGQLGLNAAPAAPRVPPVAPALPPEATAGEVQRRLREQADPAAGFRDSMQHPGGPAGWAVAQSQPEPAPAPAGGQPTQPPDAQTTTPPQSAVTAGSRSPLLRTADLLHHPGGPIGWATDQARELVSQLSPEQHQQVAGQAQSQIQQAFPATPETAKMLQNAASGRPVDRAVTERAAAKLAQNMGTEPQTAWGIVQNMSGTQQMLLAGGLGLGAIGLISMLSGSGGIMPYVLTALGLGTAAGVAGHGGLLGQGPQEFMQGIFGGGQPAGPAQSPAGAAGARQPAAAGAPPGAGTEATGPIRMLNHVATTSPQFLSVLLPNLPREAQDGLDMAIGHGGLRNQAASAYGNLTGETGRRLGAAGITPAAQGPLLAAWRQYRNPPARPQPGR